MTIVRSQLRRPGIRLGLLGGSTAAALLLFAAVAHPARLLSGLASLSASSIAAAVGATMAGVMLGAFRWRLLLGAGGTSAPASKLFAALTIGAAVNNLVPARGGDAVRVESAHQLTGASRLAIAGTMVSERMLDGFVLALLVIAGALLAGVGGVSSGPAPASRSRSQPAPSSSARRDAAFSAAAFPHSGTASPSSASGASLRRRSR
jgi:uncharacterized membrane protein YbhN (UPF0104 family)